MNRTRRTAVISALFVVGCTDGRDHVDATPKGETDSQTWQLLLATGDRFDPELMPPDPIIVVSSESTNELMWVPHAEADEYIIDWSYSRTFRAGEAERIVVEGGSRFLHSGVDVERPVFYRIIARDKDGHFGPYSRIVRSASFTGARVDIPAFTPALADWNRDGCLDAVGALGDCEGNFVPLDLEHSGLSSLVQAPRANRDSRLADFNGDGRLDIFANVYSRADDEESYAILLINLGNNTFERDANIDAMGIGGFGETIVVADFDNDDDTDIFIPNYFHLDDGGRYYLLINDGSGRFVDVATEAGLAGGAYYQPEGARALDFNEDGWIDIYVGSQLFMNNGDLTFTDQGQATNVPVRFDEGLAFSDVDLDGDLDLIHHDSVSTRLYKFDGTAFDDGVIFNDSPHSFGFGLAICDLNQDGYDDLIVADNDRATNAGTPNAFLNFHGTFVLTRLPVIRETYNDLLVCADVNNDGAPDVLSRAPQTFLHGYSAWLSQQSPAPRVRVRVMGRAGELNQHGRVVRIRSLSSTFETIKIVESGSKYMAQAGYDLTFATPDMGSYEVSVRFPSGWSSVQVSSGQHVDVWQSGVYHTRPLGSATSDGRSPSEGGRVER